MLAVKSNGRCAERLEPDRDMGRCSSINLKRVHLHAADRKPKKKLSAARRGLVTILDVPRFEVNAGEQIILRGDSGSGKTTLLHSIAGITKADTGSVTLDGIELTKLSESARDRFRAAKIGYVFQTFNLLPAFTAFENVRLGMSFGRGRYDVDRAKQLLHRVGLESRIHYRQINFQSVNNNESRSQELLPASQGCFSRTSQRQTLTQRINRKLLIFSAKYVPTKESRCCW